MSDPFDDLFDAPEEQIVTFNAPQQMRNYHQWINWRIKEDDGKQVKIPVSPHTASFASVSDPNTWGTFEQALHADPEHMAFVLTPNDPYCIIDYDKMPQPEILEWFDTYCEYSQSGRGIHIIMEGSFPVEGRKRNKEAECYQDNRYMIMTGNQHPMSNGEIKERNNHLKQWREQVGLVDKPVPPPEDARTFTCTTAQDEILERIRGSAQASKFEELWSGDTGSYPSHSDADAALLSILRFWAGGDKAVSLDLFNGSGLVRHKWTKRADYREMTWNAINSGDVYEELPPATDVDLSYIMNEIATGNVTVKKAAGKDSLEQRFHGLSGLGVLSTLCNDFNASNGQDCSDMGIFAALSIVGTLIGRRFTTEWGNTSSLYQAIIGPSGCGKNHVKKYITHVMDALPGAKVFLGKSGWTSPGAIFTELRQRPNVLSVIDELGDYISTNKNAGSVSKAQFKTLKEAWDSDHLVPQSYSDHSAARGPASRATLGCRRPCISIVGLSTPAQWWNNLTGTDCADGFLNRWLVYTSINPPSYSAGGFENLDNRPIPTEVEDWWEKINQRYPIHMLNDPDLMNEAVFNAETLPEWETLSWGPGVEDAWMTGRKVIQENYYGKPEWDLYQRVVQMACRISLIVTLAKDPMATEVTIETACWCLEFVHSVFQQMFMYLRRNMAGSEEEKLCLQLLDQLRSAGVLGLTLGDIYKLKLVGGSRRKLKEALFRLIEVDQIGTRKGKFRPKCRKSVEVFLSAEAIKELEEKEGKEDE